MMKDRVVALPSRRSVDDSMPHASRSFDRRAVETDSYSGPSKVSLAIYRLAMLLSENLSRKDVYGAPQLGSAPF